MDGNPAFTVHATAHSVRAAINLISVVTTTDLMFRKLFYLWWFDKHHVEMDLMWF